MLYLIFSILLFVCSFAYGWYYAYERPLQYEVPGAQPNRWLNVIDWLIVLILFFVAVYFSRGWSGDIHLHRTWVWLVVLLAFIGLVLLALAIRGVLTALMVSLGAMTLVAALIIAAINLWPAMASASTTSGSSTTASATVTSTSVVSSTAVATSTNLVTVTQTISPAGISVDEIDGLSVKAHATVASKDKTYVWVAAGKFRETGPKASFRFASPGTYELSLVVTDKKGNSVGNVKKVTVAANPVAHSPAFNAPLEDPGLGNCAPATQELALLRKQNPKHYLPPYTASELLTLHEWEINWIGANPQKACVQALAGSFGVTAAGLPSYYRTKLHLVVVGPTGLSVWNSYFDHTTGAIVWWRTEMLKPGEPVWLDAKGVVQDKFICLNRLRPFTPPPPAKSAPAAPSSTPSTSNNSTPPAQSTTPTTPTSSPVCVTPVYVDNTYIKVGTCSWNKKPQTWDCEQNPDPAHCPPNPQHQSPTSPGNAVQSTATLTNPGVTQAPPTPTTPKVAPTTGNSSGNASPSSSASSTRAPQTGDVSATASAGGGMPGHP